MRRDTQPARNVAYKHAKRAGAPQHLSYKQNRNKVFKVLRKAKGNFFRGLNTTGTNSKSFWKDKGKQQYIPTLKDGGNIVEDDLDKAALLNHYFSKCFNQSVNDEDIIKFWQL